MNKTNGENWRPPEGSNLPFEKWTDEQIKNVGPIYFPLFEREWAASHAALVKESGQAAHDQNTEQLQAVLRRAKETLGRISEFVDRLEQPLSPTPPSDN